MNNAKYSYAVFTQKMIIKLNNKEINVDENIAISELLLKLQIKVSQVAVEVNGEIVSRSRHSETKLKPNDKVEIVNFIGGG